MKLQVIGLDVLGNETDGFEVNDRWRLTTIECEFGHEIEALVSAFILAPHCTANNVNVEWLDDCVASVSDAENGRPLLDLEVIE